MNVFRSVNVSLNVLFGNKLRTFLSALAVGIGVAAVVMMVSTSKASEIEIAKKISNLGTDIVTVQSGKFKNVGGRTIHTARYTTLTPKDVRTIRKKVNNIKRCGGIFDRGVTVSYKSVRTRTTLMGVEPQVFEIWRVSAVLGKMFEDKDEVKLSRVCVLGQTAKKNLFKDLDPINETILVGQIPLKVIGVASLRGMDLSGEDLDDVVYIPLNTAMKRFFDVTYIENIIIQAENKGEMESVREQVTDILRKNHRLKEGKEDDFTVQTQTQLLESQMETQKAFGFLVIIVAGLSMVTGGIGIFAVMLISLRERKSEVGLRRAIGARHKDITIQFMIEALVLSLLGGIAGITVGVLGCFIIAKVNNWEFFIPVNTILYAFLISISTGLIFGIYPARLASKLEPAEALRAAV